MKFLFSASLLWVNWEEKRSNVVIPDVAILGQNIEDYIILHVFISRL